MSMRVGVIAYELEGARSGVGRYLEGLFRGARNVSVTLRQSRSLFSVQT